MVPSSPWISYVTRDPRSIHDMEQLQAWTEDAAKMLGAYRKRLEAEGFDEEDIRWMVARLEFKLFDYPIQYEDSIPDWDDEE